MRKGDKGERGEKGVRVFKPLAVVVVVVSIGLPDCCLSAAMAFPPFFALLNSESTHAVFKDQYFT